METGTVFNSTHSIRSFVQRSSGAALASMLTLGLAASLLAAGCNKSSAPAAEPATAASAPVAPAASAPAPAASTAAPAPPPPAAAVAAAPAVEKAAPPPARRTYTVPVGTRLAVRIQQTISAKQSNVGDSFSGTLAQSVVVRGVSVIRAGAPVTGKVTAAKGQGRFKGSGDLAIALTRVGDYEVSTSSYEAVSKGKGKRTAGFIGGGGGGGALIGGLAGGGKGALIGGLLGAGAGTAGAALTGNKDITVPAETVVSFSLTEPVTITGR